MNLPSLQLLVSNLIQDSTKHHQDFDQHQDSTNRLQEHLKIKTTQVEYMRRKSGCIKLPQNKSTTHKKADKTKKLKAKFANSRYPQAVSLTKCRKCWIDSFIKLIN